MRIQFYKRQQIEIALYFLLDLSHALLPAFHLVLEHDPLAAVEELLRPYLGVVSEIAGLIYAGDEVSCEVGFLLPESEAVPVEDLAGLVGGFAKAAVYKFFKLLLALLIFETGPKLTLTHLKSLILEAFQSLLVGVVSL